MTNIKKCSDSKIQVKQIASSIGKKPTQKKTLLGLGLKRINATKTLTSTESIKGMVEKVKHLLEIKNL